MIGQTILAQVGSSSLYTTSGSGPNLGVLAAIGALILIVIVIAIIRNRGNPSGRSSSFNKGAFRRAARAAGLAEEELRSLEEYARASGLSNPDFVFRNAQKLDSFFQDAYRQIDKVSDSEGDAEERKALLFSARERLAHARAQGGAVRSSRQLGRGTPLTFIAPGEESYPSVILAVEPSGLAVEPVYDSYGEALRFRRGSKFTCFFYAKGHEGYQFDTHVTGWEKIGGKDAMVLAHSEAVRPLPARRHTRRAMKAPCTFYRVAVSAGGAGGKGKKGAAKVENIPYPGTIVDISAGGLGIQCASPLSAGEYVKITFSAAGGAQAAFAKVIRMNRAKAMGGIMHVQFVKISRQGLNAILSFVYGYAD
jgi:c-di-GMP-binding flagellar brake protein YcgR